MLFPSHISVAELNAMGQGDMIGFLGITYTRIGVDFLEARMLVDEWTRQLYGLLHGGASVVLAETVGSMAANLVIDAARRYCVGLDINANHIRSVTEGVVCAVAERLHVGRLTQVWQIRIADEGAAGLC